MANGNRWGNIGALFGVLCAGYLVGRRDVATKPRPWPNNALQARDHAIMELVVATRHLRRAVEESGSLTRMEQLRCEAVALVAVQAALRELESTQ